MSHSDSHVHSHKTVWRELSRSYLQRELVYFISGSPQGVREVKIKAFIQEAYGFSEMKLMDSSLEKLEADGLLTRERTKGGSTVWVANPPLVIDLVQKELEAMKTREEELRSLRTFLVDMYLD